MSSEFLTELYKDLPKLGPGSKETIRKAFSMLTNLPPKPTILDVGCGTGMTTIELAKISNGTVIGLDINSVYLDILQKHAKDQGVADKIQTINKDLRSMDFEENRFDVIWTETVYFSWGLNEHSRNGVFFSKEAVIW